MFSEVSASELGSYSVLPASAKGAQQSALLTQLQQQTGLVTPDELLELEDLINSARTKESDFQRFFERHPHFLRMWDHREVHPQVCLTRESEGPLIPDFILVDPVLSRATIVELKLPTARVVTAKPNRERFSSMVEDARAQLLEYRDWFEEKHNRENLKSRFGLEIYRPRLAMIL